MKLLLIFILSITAIFAAKGQDDAIKAITDDNYNFKLINNNVSWQYAFQTDLNATQIIAYFLKHPSLRVDFTDSVFVKARIDGAKIDPRKYGVALMEAAIFTRYPMSAVVSIDIKDGKYRVTVSNIDFAPTTVTSLWGVTSNSNSRYTLTEMAYNQRKEKFKDSFWSNYAPHLIAGYFLDEFTIKATPKSGDDW